MGDHSSRNEMEFGMTADRLLNKTGDIWALVVCFHPDEELLLALVRQLSAQVSELWILNNGGIHSSLESQFMNYPNLHIHTFKSNVGIATALNFGFSLAAMRGAEFVVTFDQDSQPTGNHVEVLATTWKTLARQDTQKVGAIGPSFFDDRGSFFQYPFYRANGLRVKKIFPAAGGDVTPVDALITSGMLVPVFMWKEGLKFREDLFIEYVDTEWCFRASAAGFMHFGCFAVSMRHQLSDANASKFLGMIFLKYSPIRRYYYFRNTLLFVACAHVPFAYKPRLMIGLAVRLLAIPFVDDKPMASLAHALRGLFDGIFGKGGKLES
jgi:rhamnosyltransferase